VISLADKPAWHGSASVRSCSRKCTKYVVGLEFSAGMKFKPKPPKDVAPEASHSEATEDALSGDHGLR
jgi:hypothetical protein